MSELASEVLRLSSRAIESYTDSCYKDINRHPAMLKTAYWMNGNINPPINGNIMMLQH